MRNFFVSAADEYQMWGHLLSAVYRCPLTAKRVLHAFCSTLFAYFGITKNLMKAMVWGW